MSISDLELYRSFVAIVDAGSFNAAAQVLDVSQPSLTRRMQRLEAALDKTLLERGPWGLRLTEAGQLFYSGAQRVVATVEDVLAETSTTRRLTVRLGAAATAAGSFLARRLSVWLPEHPEVRFVMIEDGALKMTARLEQGECDIGVVAAPVPAGFESRYLTTVRVEALFPDGHPMAEDDGPVPIGQLHGERVLLNAEGFLSAELFQTACRAAGVEPDIVYRSSVGQTLAALAEGGMGVAILGDSVDLRGFTLPRRPVAAGDGETLAFDLHIAWLQHRRLPASVLALVDWLSEGEA